MRQKPGHVVHVLLLVLVLTVSTYSATFYVQPQDAVQTCTREHCNTLKYYAITRRILLDATLIFISGNHGFANETFKFKGLSNITLRSFNSSVVNIKSTMEFSYTFGISITGISFSPNTLTFKRSQSIYINNCIFYRANLVLHFSKATVFSSTFTEFDDHFIAVEWSSWARIENCTFSGNKGIWKGGAVYCSGTDLILINNNFNHNTAVTLGGALNCVRCNILLEGDNVFYNNSDFHHLKKGNSKGGAMYFNKCSAMLTGKIVFITNSAIEGGAIYSTYSKIVFNGSNIQFVHNNALKQGGGIFLECSPIFCLNKIELINNTVIQRDGNGGALAVYNFNCRENNLVPYLPVNLNATFSGNSADNGAAIYLVSATLKLISSSFIRNRGKGALVAIYSNITMKVHTLFMHNSGGAIYSDSSNLRVDGLTNFVENITPLQGGAINIMHGRLHLQGEVTFRQNKAENGGALSAYGTSIFIYDKTNFTQNAAINNGGAMNLENGAFIVFSTNKGERLISFEDNFVVLFSAHNSAGNRGGSVYHSDNPTSYQCTNFGLKDRFNYAKHVTGLPYCFFQTDGLKAIDAVKISSQFDRAGTGRGNFLYGGLLTKCKVRDSSVVNELFPSLGVNFLTSKLVEDRDSLKVTAVEVTSRPYELCFCKSDKDIGLYYFQCRKVLSLATYRGRTLQVSLFAASQFGAAPTIVHAVLGTTGRVQPHQTFQAIPGTCNIVNYTVFSTENKEEFSIFADGPCRNSLGAGVTVNATILPCPAGFIQALDVCNCEKRLLTFNIQCLIDEFPYFVKSTGSNFWIASQHFNESYQGLIIANNCPVGYCSKAIEFTMDCLDKQCDQNRSGIVVENVQQITVFCWEGLLVEFALIHFLLSLLSFL